MRSSLRHICAVVVFFGATMAAAGVLSGCQQADLDPDISAAHAAFVAAVKNKDIGGLYAMAPTEVQEFFHSLYEDWTAAVEDVRDDYPAHERDAVLDALAADRLENVNDGKELFGALLDFDSVHAGEAVDKGLLPTSIQRTGEQGVVQTSAGESFRYALEGGTWRAETLRAQVERYPTLKRLRANIKAVRQNLETWERATTESLDTRKPEGAFNVVVRAVQRGARVMLYEQLDAPSKKHLTEAYTAVAALQKQLEKRFPAADARRKYLSEKKLAWVDRVADDKSLFAAMWDAGVFADELALKGEVKVKGTEDGTTPEERVVIADVAGKEKKVLFRRALDGTYRLASLDAAILREGARRFEAELRAVPAGKDQPK